MQIQSRNGTLYLNKQKRAVSNDCSFLLLDCLMAVNSKPGLIPEEDIPFNEVDPVVFSQSSM